MKINTENWECKPNMCHHNTAELWRHDNSYTPIRGWLYFDLPELDCVKFLSHSVVRLPNGEFVDITPKQKIISKDYPFL